MKFCLNILPIISILFIVCFVIICIISFIENRRLTITKYVIKAKRLPKAFDGFHIVQLSDMHNASFGKDNEKLLDKIRALSPDIILVTGDMIIAKPGTDVRFASDMMNQFVSIAPVYFSLGNHELRSDLYTEVYGTLWQDFYGQLDKRIKVLRNESVDVWQNGQRLRVYGLDLTPELYRRFKQTPMDKDYLNNLFGCCEEKDYHIFMAHNPDYFKQYADWGADLTFSGHVHGGMVRIPFLGGALSPMVHFFPKYDKGLFEYANKYMILSGGLGSHTFRFRVNNLPEIVSVTLKSAAN